MTAGTNIHIGADTKDAIKGFGALSHSLNDAGREFAKFGKVVASGRNVLDGAVDGILDVGRGLTIMNPIAGIAVTVVGGLVKSFFEAKYAAEEVAKTLSTKGNLAEAIKSSEYKSAIKLVGDLKSEIQAAKEDIRLKDTVLDHYNETIGKTTGKVSGLDEAEKALVKNGEAYIKMTLLKAAANVALEKAAQKRIDAEFKKQQDPQEFGKWWSNIFNFNPAGRFYHNKDQKDKAIKEDEDMYQQFLKLADKFSKQAKGIADANGFTIIPLDENKEVKKAENIFDKVHDALKGVMKQMKEDWDKEGENDANAYYDAWEKALKKKQATADQLAGTTEAQRLGIVGIAPTGRNNQDSIPDSPGTGQKSAAELERDHLKRDADNQTKLQEALAQTTFMVQTLGSVFGELFENIASGSTNALKTFGQAIAQIIKKLVSAAITAAIFAAIISATGIGGAVFASGKGAFGKNFGSVLGMLSGIPKFASGGIVSRPTLAMVGEGGEKEAIIPLSKLNTIIGSAGGSNVVVGGRLTIEGRELVALIESEQKSNKRLF